MKNSVLQLADTELKVLLKKLRVYYRYELTFSVDVPSYLLRGELDIVDEIYKILGDTQDYKKANAIMNLYKCLEANYPFDDFDYGTDSYLDTAIKIWNKYHEKIQKYMLFKMKKGFMGPINTPYHTPEQAFREQVHRGFLPSKDSSILKKYHLKSTIIPIVFGEFKDMEEATKFQDRMGITGYTGIHQPI